MILTAHQPVYLPWLGLFHKISLADKFCFFDDVQYEVRGWNNRNYIKGNNSDKMLLTVPVLSKGHIGKSYMQLKINNGSSWQKKHWGTIECVYKKHPYFDLYADDLLYFYKKRWEYLVDLNFEMLLYFLKVLNINIEVVRMSDNVFSGEKSSLVLDMCRKLNADAYIFGKLGADYADVVAFNRYGIEVEFQDYQHPVYPQISSVFTEGLSIIDLLFNCGDEAKAILLHDNVSNFVKEG